MKYCIGCKYLHYDEPGPGCQGSTLTGTYGDEEAALACKKGYWREEFGRWATVDTFATAMMKAETCVDYEERKIDEEPK